MRKDLSSESVWLKWWKKVCDLGGSGRASLDALSCALPISHCHELLLLAEGNALVESSHRPL
jgi:hypothetical protein